MFTLSQTRPSRKCALPRSPALGALPRFKPAGGGKGRGRCAAASRPRLQMLEHLPRQGVQSVTASSGRTGTSVPAAPGGPRGGCSALEPARPKKRLRRGPRSEPPLPSAWGRSAASPAWRQRHAPRPQHCRWARPAQIRPAGGRGMRRRKPRPESWRVARRRERPTPKTARSASVQPQRRESCSGGRALSWPEAVRSGPAPFPVSLHPEAEATAVALPLEAVLPGARCFVSTATSTGHPRPRAGSFLPRARLTRCLTDGSAGASALYGGARRSATCSARSGLRKWSQCASWFMRLLPSQAARETPAARLRCAAAAPRAAELAFGAG